MANGKPVASEAASNATLHQGGLEFLDPRPLARAFDAKLGDRQPAFYEAGVVQMIFIVTRPAA